MERSSSFDRVGNVDCISKLPDDILVVILSNLSTEEAIRTSALSKRWEHVWKQRSDLVLDMRRFMDSRKVVAVSSRVATLLTKIINSHLGHLESCEIDHYSYQCENGMLNAWIQSLNGVKHTKHLSLRHHIELVNCGEFLDFPANSFSYPTLTSLSLEGHLLKSSNSFNNCQNLKTLKLLCIFASEVGVFNRVLASCSSLRVLVLQICCFKKSGPLKIENDKLELLKVSSCADIDGIQVSSTSLHILILDMNSMQRDEFVLTSPRLLFNTDFWPTRPFFPHISYNISQEEKSMGHEELVVHARGELFSASLSVNVDLKNEREVERLRQVLLLFPMRMVKLEMSFKNDKGPREKNKWWEEKNKKPFPNSRFRVDTVLMHNFSGSEEELALASCLITQGTVVNRMMIKTRWFSARKKVEIERAVGELEKLKTKYQGELSIKCV